MKPPLSVFCSAAVACFACAFSSPAALYLDDTWADGTRTDQNLPVESAWFASTGSQLAAATNAMTLTIGSGSVMVITYFTTNAATPVRLELGDTLTVSLTMQFNTVASPNTSQGWRLALCNFADSSTPRLTADSYSTSSQGTGVQGYALFQNVGTTFSSASPMDLRKRTTVGDSALLSSSGDWTSLGTGPADTNAFPGFANGTNYLLQLTLQRTGPGSLNVTMKWVNLGTGASLTTTVTDNAATNFSFDAIALRPSGSSSTAASATFSEAKVELTPGSTAPSITVEPQDRAVYVGQDASFTVVAGGTAPLEYQWFYATNILLTDATNSMLTITNAQLADAGSYSVMVSNDFGAVTSVLAQLTVTVPTAPSILTQPQDLTAIPGQTATFSVAAAGSEPLSYQWYYNSSTPVPGATEAVLTLTNVQLADAGYYSVVVNNLAGSVTSSNAILTIDTNPIAPVFVTQPASSVVLAGGSASFDAVVAGTTPIAYQWWKNGAAIAGASSSTLTLTNVQLSDAGSYTLTASNSVGGATSLPATLAVTPYVPIPNTAYNLVGFAQGTTGGGIVPESNTTAWRKVYNAVDLATVLNDKTGNVKVIEIMNDLDLGYDEIPAAAKANSEPFRQDTTPSLHPVLVATGVSKIDVQDKSNLTIFSASGATIRHAHLNVKRCSNLIIRNLKFDELWEWDEATKGDYDSKNWDFITIGDSGTCTGVWVDHCTFTKSYDGALDIKGGSSGITVSWCKFAGDDGASNTNSFVRQQINFLEQSPSSYPMYNFLRTRGFSVEDIVQIIQGHDKTMLIGANDFDPENANFTVTLHHDWFVNPWDRLPRLRAGNVHNFNLYVDDTVGLAARRLRDTRAAALSPTDRNTLNNTYSFKPFLNGSISTEGGALLIEKSVYIDCLAPLRNNQTDPSNPAYTGKIMALDTIYRFDSATVRGNSTDPGSPLRPVPAAIIAFSWNLAGNQLPYSYSMDDPGQLESIVTNPAGGAGAGVLTWDKTNWLATAYAASAPIIVASPQSQTAGVGDSVTFVVVAGGSAPLSYQWYFNTNTPLPNATNSTLMLTNLQGADAGSYSVVVTNNVGSAPSAFALLTVGTGGTGFVAWQAEHFTAAELSDPSISGPNASPAGDGVPNFVKYALGLEPFVPAPQPLVQFRLQGGQGVLSYNRPASVPDVIYRAETATNLPAWSTNGMTQQLVGTNSAGLQTWDATYSGITDPVRFFRLLLLQQ